MLSTSKLLGKLGYGLLYIPSLSFGYLFTQSISGSVLLVPSLSILQHTVIASSTYFSHNILLFLTIVSLFGGVWLHKAAITTFGYEGPSENPKEEEVVKTVMMGVAFNVKIEKLEHSSSILHLFLQSLNYLNKFSLITFMFFIPAGIFKPLFYLSAWLLAIHSVTTGNIYTGLLFLAHFTSIVDSWVSVFFPNYVPEDAVERINKAEYKIAVEKYQDSLNSEILEE
jgi:hypothetical protein